MRQSRRSGSVGAPGAPSATVPRNDEDLAAIHAALEQVVHSSVPDLLERDHAIDDGAHGHGSAGNSRDRFSELVSRVREGARHRDLCTDKTLKRIIIHGWAARQGISQLYEPTAVAEGGHGLPDRFRARRRDEDGVERSGDGLVSAEDFVGPHLQPDLQARPVPPGKDDASMAQPTEHMAQEHSDSPIANDQRPVPSLRSTPPGVNRDCKRFSQSQEAKIDSRRERRRERCPTGDDNLLGEATVPMVADYMDIAVALDDRIDHDEVSDTCPHRIGAGPELNHAPNKFMPRDNAFLLPAALHDRARPREVGATDTASIDRYSTLTMPRDRPGRVLRPESAPPSTFAESSHPHAEPTCSGAAWRPSSTPS